jgi:PST family polysaccharide transporter
VLPWLVALAALRILYELCYDFFVVLKSTRVVLTAQLLWLAGLISLTILLTRMWQAPGAGMAGLAAGLLVLPLYARELHRVAVPLLALARQLVVPASMAVMLGPVAWMLAGVLGNDLVALATAAVVVGAVIAVLVYRMRGVLLALRATGVGDPVDEDETSASSALATGRA